MPASGATTIVAMEHDELLQRLKAHAIVGGLPDAELEWLIAHGRVEQYEPGAFVSRKGVPVEGIVVVFSGLMSHMTDQGGTWRKVLDWRGGDVTGQLPYSRMLTAPGNTVVQEPAEALIIPVALLPRVPVECPQLTAALVHVMLDRARTFKQSDLQLEKMASLGRLAAGLAHELNNPASAAARSAQLLSQTLAESDEASRALGATALDASEAAAIERVRTICLNTPATSVLSPLERADREEAFAGWLTRHGVDDALSAPLAETDVDLPMLDELAGTLRGDKLRAALRWIAAGCTVRGLAREVERAASRVHTLVSAVKGFTYMDRATAPDLVDIKKGLDDTLAVMSPKARGKSAALEVDVPPDLPAVRAIGGELNQVWGNLVDNALDAVSAGGRVTVSAKREGDAIVIRVVDNGPGIPPEIREKIFDTFFTTKPVGQGTGLGLDIVRRLVERNDGRLDFESVPGRTEFRVSLPVAA